MRTIWLTTLGWSIPVGCLVTTGAMAGAGITAVVVPDTDSVVVEAGTRLASQRVGSICGVLLTEDVTE